MAGGNSELAEVQEKLELLNTEYDRLNDEWTGRLAAQQDEFQREKYVSHRQSVFVRYIFRSYVTRSQERASKASHRKVLCMGIGHQQAAVLYKRLCAVLTAE